MDRFEEIKTSIEHAYEYFLRNYQRSTLFKRMIAETSINDNQRAFLGALGRPIAEFNILVGQINALLGEFDKIDPVLNVTQRTNGMQKVPFEIQKLVEGYVSHIIDDASTNSVGKRLYKDVITGGWGVARVSTDYTHPFSTQQSIYVRHCNPVMTGFDPMATEKHKGDGRYSFEVYPLTAKDFKDRYPDEDIDDLSSSMHVGPFQWSQTDVRGNKIMLVCEFFEKRTKRTRIVELSTGEVVKESEYKKMLREWDSFAVPPIIVGQARTTTYDEVWRVEICNKKILREQKTDWSYLPHVFLDGDSELLTEATSGSQYQFCKSVVFPLVGVQDLKNASGQALLNALDNMVQSKFVVKKEAIPQEQDYIDSITNIQKVGTVVVNAYSENNPDKPIPDPIRELTQTPAPPEVLGGFQVADQTAQSIMGSFSSNLGRESNDLSGKAILEAASIDGKATLPYLDGYLKGLEWIGVIILDLIPKYILGERDLPVKMPDGKRHSVHINDTGKTIDYKPYSLDLKVKAAFTSEVQQTRALQQITSMAQAMPMFAQFMNSEVGMPVLIRNMTIKDSEELLEGFQQWSQQQAKAAQEAAQQPTPDMMIGQAELLKAQVNQMKAEIEGQWRAMQSQLDAAKFMLEQQRVENETIETQAKVEDAVIQKALEREKDKADIVGKNLENAERMAELVLDKADSND